MMTTKVALTRSALLLVAAAAGSIALALLGTACSQVDPARGSLIPSASGGAAGGTGGTHRSAGGGGSGGSGGGTGGASSGGVSGGVSGGGNSGGGR